MALFFNLLKIFTDFRRPTDSAIRKTGRNIIRKAEIHKNPLSLIRHRPLVLATDMQYVNIHTHRPVGRGIELRTAGIHPWVADRVPVASLLPLADEVQAIGESRARFRKAGTERGPIRRIPVPTGTGPPIRPTRRAPLRAGIRRGDARTTGLPATGSDLPRIHRLA